MPAWPVFIAASILVISVLMRLANRDWTHRYWLAITAIGVVPLMFADMRVRYLAAFKLFLLLVSYPWGEAIDSLRRKAADQYLLGAGIGFVALVVWAGYGLTVAHSPENIAIGIYYLSQPLLFFVLFRLDESAARHLARNLIAIGMAAVPVALLGLQFQGRFRIGFAAIGGHLSHLALPGLLALLSRRRNARRAVLGGPQWRLVAALWALLLSADVFLGGNRRFWFPVGLTILVCLARFWTSWPARIGQAVAAASLAFVFFAGVIDRLLGENLDRGLGWRDAEWSLTKSQSLGEHPWIGLGPGYQSQPIVIASDLVRMIGPNTHSLWVLTLLSGGFGLLVCLLPFYLSSIGRSVRVMVRGLNPLPVLMGATAIGWLIAAFFDAPRDGHWVLGIALAAACHDNKFIDGDG